MRPLPSVIAVVTVLLFANSAVAACPKGADSAVSCGAEAAAATFIPSRGRIAAFEDARRQRFLYLGMSWDTPSALSWFKTVSHASLEPDVVFNVRESYLTALVDDQFDVAEPQVIAHRRLPCQYLDTQLFDKGNPTLTVGSGCADKFEADALYYTLASAQGTAASGDFGLRFQRGVWVDWTNPAAMTGAPDICGISTGLTGRVPNPVSYPLCVFSCCEAEQNVAVIEIPTSKGLGGAVAPGCYDWSADGEASQCSEQDCENGLDDDLDGLTDCADSECEATAACPELCPGAGDCAGIECGTEPVCGNFCGKCTGSFVCDQGTCRAPADGGDGGSGGAGTDGGAGQGGRNDGGTGGLGVGVLDLAVASVSVLSRPSVVGDSMKVEVRFANVGSVGLDGAVTYYVLRSSDKDVNMADPQLASFAIAANKLGGGATLVETRTIATTGVPAGQYYFGGYVDGNFRFDESNEGNNAAFDPVPVALCAEACTIGATRCNGAAQETCANYGPGACNGWGGAMSCPSAQCANGACVACGGVGQACCPGASSCAPGGYCNAGMCVGTGCPSELDYLKKPCGTVLNFNETASWVPAPTKFASAPIATDINVDPSKFSANARMSSGYLDVRKTLIGAAAGAFGVQAYWSGLGAGQMYIKVQCASGDVVQCTGQATPTTCTGAWQIVQANQADPNASCGFGTLSGDTFVDWVAIVPL